MPYTATLVGPAKNTVTTAQIISVQVHFSVGKGVDTATWLAPGRAVKIPLNGYKPSPEKIRTLRDSFKAQGIALFVQNNAPSEMARKSLGVFDMESTIVDFEALDELALATGLGEQVARITQKAMNGTLDFRQALKERVDLLKNTSTHTLEKARQTMMKKINPGARELIATMRHHGATCVLVTGGFTFFANPLAEELGFDAVHANTLEIKNGKLTGHVCEPVLDRNAKLTFLKQYANELGIGTSQVLAIGDGANDLDMLKEAGLGIGYCPKPIVEDQILHIIPKGGLDAALYAQGYLLNEIQTSLVPA